MRRTRCSLPPCNGLEGKELSFVFLSKFNDITICLFLQARNSIRQVISRAEPAGQFSPPLGEVSVRVGVETSALAVENHTGAYCGGKK
ncbi:MAG: hypothetical protein KAW12_18095 [Candidatus Aminicenantes bacterium]|nr:hypothetical protein [Candidatus Aminicenantes bacterium]